MANQAYWISGTPYIGSGELVRLTVPLTPFGDVTYWHWARDEINACALAKIVLGYPEGAYSLYRPEVEVTRDQMAACVSRAVSGGDSRVPAPPEKPTFPDVPAGHWAYRYIECASSRSNVQGYPDGSHQPAVVVTREQMAVYIARTFKLSL